LLAYPTDVEPQVSEGFPVQRVDHLGFLSIQAHPEWSQRFFKPLEGAFRPASFGVVAADGDDDIIGEPMIVHCLVRPLCRLAWRIASKAQSTSFK
jgi:hypothetical protein